MKLSIRSIYKITDYSFDGLIHKPRYIILLQLIDDIVIYATVSKSQILPTKFTINERKLKDSDGKYWCFKFEKDDIVGISRNFKFPETSYINVTQRPSVFMSDLKEFEKILKDNSSFVDFLDNKIHGELLYTISHGQHITRKIKKTILPLLEKYFGTLND